MTKTQIAILWGLAVVILVAFFIVGRVLSRPTQEGLDLPGLPGKTYSLPGVPFAAKAFFPRAQQAALSWQGDAQFVSATASWPFVRLDNLSMPVEWVFQFFSSATQKMFIVSVDEKTVTPMRSSLTPYPLPTASVDMWKVDSYEAINAWLNHGGGDFLDAHPAVDVSARLLVSQEGQLEWLVVGTLQNSQEIQLTRVNAENGVILK